MKIAERNYSKKPHTARFLMAFHAGSQGLPSDITPEEEPETITTYSFGTVKEADDTEALAAEAAEAAQDDLLDMVPETTVADLRTKPQADLMAKLIDQITALDSETGEKARTWTEGMTSHGEWVPRTNDRRDPSRWIATLIQKERALRQAAARTTPPVPVAEVADGRYAVEEGGVLKFFRVKNGRKAGYVFLDIQASDDWHGVRNLGRIREVLALIAVDAKAAMVRYGHELGQCGRCGKTLTDEASRAAGIGPVCIDK